MLIPPNILQGVSAAASRDDSRRQLCSVPPRASGWENDWRRSPMPHGNSHEWKDPDARLMA